MTCPAFSRPCDLPTVDESIPNLFITDITQDATSVTLTWDYPSDGFTSEGCFVFSLGGVVVDHVISDGLKTHNIELDQADVLDISYRRELDGGAASGWDHTSVVFVAGVVDSDPIVHEGIQLTHNGEVLVHTYNTRYLLLEDGTALMQEAWPGVDDNDPYKILF